MPQPHENARVFLVIILLLWLASSPDGGPGLITPPSQTAARLARQRRAHGVLNSTKWGDFFPRLIDAPTGTAARYLNLTGFRAEDGLAWEDLGRFRDKCLEWSHNANTEGWDLGLAEPTWQNVSGAVHGEWVRRNGSVARHAASYNLSDVTSEAAWIGHHGAWTRNVTGDHGQIVLRLDEKNSSLEYDSVEGDQLPKSGGLVREISATVAIEDDANGLSAWDMRMHGVHWPRQGVILLTTTSEKFAGIFGLPHLTPGPDFYRSSQRLLNETLDRLLLKKEQTKFANPSSVWSSAIGEEQADIWNTAPHCEYILYAQIHPLAAHQLRVQIFGHKARDWLGDHIKNIEDELRHPTGAPIRGIPELQLSTVIWSPDCSFFLESKGPPRFPSIVGEHLVGMKEEVLLYRSKMWLLLFAASLFGQVQLLKGQMRESSTPSTIGRVSFYTVSTMVLADGLVFAAALAWSLSASTTLLPSLILSLAAFMSMIIGGAFLSEIYKVQEPERRSRDREQAGPASSTSRGPPPTPAAAAAAAAAARAATSLSTDLPRPVTAGPPRPPSPPIIIPSDQDIDAEILENVTAGATAVPAPAPTILATTTTAAAAVGNAAQQIRATPFSSITGRFILLGTFILFLSLATTSWPAPWRAAYANLLAFTYLSLWVPQIWRNVRRNSRRATSWRFTIGQSGLRLLPLAYFYLRRDNVLFAQPDRPAFAALAAWLWIQLWALAAQDVLGPRFGVPKGWVPDAWDYHPILREDGLEGGGLPIGLIASASAVAADDDDEGERSSRKRRRKSSSGSAAGAAYTHSIDCAICREVLEVPVIPAARRDADVGGGGVAALLARRAYMVTPCRHIFHSACLEGWLRFRLQCPICREELPPL